MTSTSGCSANDPVRNVFVLSNTSLSFDRIEADLNSRRVAV